MNHGMRYEAAPRIPGRISAWPAPKNALGTHSGHSAASFPVQTALFGAEKCDPDPLKSISLSHSTVSRRQNAREMHSAHSRVAFPAQTTPFETEKCDLASFKSISLSHSPLCDAEMPEGIPLKADVEEIRESFDRIPVIHFPAGR